MDLVGEGTLLYRDDAPERSPALRADAPSELSARRCAHPPRALIAEFAPAGPLLAVAAAEYHQAAVLMSASVLRSTNQPAPPFPPEASVVNK